MALPIRADRDTQDARCNELAQLIKAGDQDAFAEFVSLTRQIIKGEISRFGSLSRQDREDITQTVLTVFWVKRHHWWTTSAVGYLVTVTRRETLDFIRRTRRRPDVLVRDPEITVQFSADSAPGPEDSLLSSASEAETFEQWAPLIDALPEHLRMVVRCRLEGFSPDATAEALSISFTDVWDRLLEGTSMLRAAAGLPACNRWLESRLCDFKLWPGGNQDAAPVVRSLPPYIRRSIYLRLSGDGWAKMAGLTRSQKSDAFKAFRIARQRLGIQKTTAC